MTDSASYAIIPFLALQTAQAKVIDMSAVWSMALAEQLLPIFAGSDLARDRGKIPDFLQKFLLQTTSSFHQFVSSDHEAGVAPRFAALQAQMSLHMEAVKSYRSLGPPLSVITDSHPSIFGHNRAQNRVNLASKKREDKTISETERNACRVEISTQSHLASSFATPENILNICSDITKELISHAAALVSVTDYVQSTDVVQTGSKTRSP